MNMQPIITRDAIANHWSFYNELTDLAPDGYEKPLSEYLQDETLPIDQRLHVSVAQALLTNEQIMSLAISWTGRCLSYMQQLHSAEEHQALSSFFSKISDWSKAPEGSLLPFTKEELLSLSAYEPYRNSQCVAACATILMDLVVGLKISTKHKLGRIMKYCYDAADAEASGPALDSTRTSRKNLIKAIDAGANAAHLEKQRQKQELLSFLITN